MFYPNRQFVVATSIVVFTIACGPPKIDGSSGESIGASTKKICESLTPEACEDFTQALALIMFQDVTLPGLFSGLGDPKFYAENLVQKTGQRIDGMTAIDVFTEAARILQEKKSAAEELKAENQRKEQEKRDFLSQFKVLESKLSDRKPKHRFDVYGLRELTLKVRNETQFAIQFVGFKVTVFSPDRAVPWVEENDVSEVVQGGIEPGEEMTLRLRMSQLGMLEHAEYPSNAEVRVEVVTLSGPNFQPVSIREALLGEFMKSRDAPSLPEEQDALLTRLTEYISGNS